MSGIISGAYSNVVPYQAGAGYASMSGNVQKAGKPVLNPGADTQISPGRKSSPAECETCKNRKYQDEIGRAHV